MADDSDYAIYIQNLRAVVTAPWGKELVQHLRTRFVEPRALVQEVLPTGQVTQRLARQIAPEFTDSSAHRYLGRLEVIAFLEDLQEWEVTP